MRDNGGQKVENYCPRASITYPILHCITDPISVPISDPTALNC